MESRADYVAAKVAENLNYEALLAIIGAVCPSPSQAAKKCLELGIAPEGEKLAKWVAVLKRESSSSDEFLGKLMQIYYNKQEAEMAEDKNKPNQSQIDKARKWLTELRDHMNGIGPEALLEKKRAANEKFLEEAFMKLFVEPWMRRLAERLKRSRFGGRLIASLEEGGYCDVRFRPHFFVVNLPDIQRIFPRELGFRGELRGLLSKSRQSAIFLEFKIEKMMVEDITTAYGRIPFDKVKISTMNVAKQAESLAKWMVKAGMVRSADDIEVNNYDYKKHDGNWRHHFFPPMR